MANRRKTTSQIDTAIQPDTTTEEKPYEEIRRICAPIHGDIGVVMRTTVTLRNHGVCIYNCKTTEGPNVYGEIPDDLNWKQFILPEESKIEETDTKTFIVLPDGFKFVCDLPDIGTRKGKEIYLTEPYVSLIEEETFCVSEV